MSGGRFKRSHSGADLPSARGFSCVLATCDGNREREATKELLNLLEQALETRYPQRSSAAVTSSNDASKTLCDLLQEELSDIKKSSKMRDQPLVSVSTGTKGVVLVVIKDATICAKELFYEIFLRIRRDKQMCCRHIVRMIPFQKVVYPDLEELKATLTELIQLELLVPNEGAESAVKRQCVDPAVSSFSQALPKRWCVDFKARNHDTLRKQEVYDMVTSVMPPGYRVDYKHPEVLKLFPTKIYFDDERTSAVY